MPGWLGSMASRSPIERPFSLPPIFTGMSIVCQRVAAIARAEDGAVADPRAGVRPGGQVDLVGVDRIGRQALDAEEVRVAPQLIGERDPDLAGRVPAVGAADVGAGVHEPLLDGAEDDAADEAAAENDDVLPVVGRAPLQAAALHSLGRGRRSRRGRPTRRLRRHATGADRAGGLAQQRDDPRQRHRPGKCSRHRRRFLCCVFRCIFIAGRHRRFPSRRCRDRPGRAVGDRRPGS